jgi:ribosomal protein L37AE/L43A
MRNDYSKKPRKCPNCGSKNIARIQYGMPVYSEKLEKDLAKNKIVLGGCVISGDDPKWQCTNCKERFFKIMNKPLK